MKNRTMMLFFLVLKFDNQYLCWRLTAFGPFARISYFCVFWNREEEYSKKCIAVNSEACTFNCIFLRIDNSCRIYQYCSTTCTNLARRMSNLESLMRTSSASYKVKCKFCKCIQCRSYWTYFECIKWPSLPLQNM